MSRPWQAHKATQALGLAPDLPNNAVASCWTGSGLITFAQIPGPVTIQSDSVLDSAAVSPSGAHEVIVLGIAAGTFEERAETVVLDGLNPVNTSESFYAVNSVFVTAGNRNDGNITATLDGSVQAHLRAGDGRSAQAIYTVPKLPDSEKNFHAHLTWVYVNYCNRNRNSLADAILRIKLPGKPAFGLPVPLQAGAYPLINVSSRFKFPPLARIWVDFERTTRNNGRGSAGFELMWIEEGNPFEEAMLARWAAAGGRYKTSDPAAISGLSFPFP